jgi:uncharacterized membrane protein
MPTADLPTTNRSLIGTAHVIFLLLLLAMLAQIAWYYPQLPERVASHFNAAGEANSFMPKRDFVKVHLGVVGLLSVMFLFLPAAIVRLPPGLINLPNKDYWLAPERRQSTARTITGNLLGFGNAMLLFLLLVFREAMRASLLPVPRLPNRIWIYLVLLFAFAIFWTVRFVRAFRLPD